MHFRIKEHWHASKEELSGFALSMSWAIPLIFTLILPWLFDKPWQLWPLGISAYLLIANFTWKPLLLPVYVFWMMLAAVLGYINTRLILAIIYYLIMLPIGIFLRLTKKLQYQRNPKKAETYWIRREKSPEPTDLERPF